jgi:hypothetical protein
VTQEAVPPAGATEPAASRPRMFGGHLDPVRLPWQWATERLTAARNYWIATTRPDGRPHTRPVWGVWLDGRFYFSTGSLAAKNLVDNPEITVHLESGSEVVIIEGVAEKVDAGPLVSRVAEACSVKYHWDLDPSELAGALYAVRSRVAFGWVSDPSGLDRGSEFHGTATRWRFDAPTPGTAPTG